MATTLINTRKAIMSQIHANWNEFRSTDEAMDMMFGEVGSNYSDYHDIPLAKDFEKGQEPWSSKQSVLERNAVHANNLIRLYIALDIKIEERMLIWQFFEIGTGIVGKIKEQIKLLKRITKVLKKQQQFDMDLSNATDMFLGHGRWTLDELERRVKKYPQKMTDIKAAKKRNAALKRAKKEQKRKDSNKEKKQAEYNKKVLKMLKVAEKEGYTLQDVVTELERQLQ